MDAIKNPFSPGAGSPPPLLVGRDEFLEEARVLLGRVMDGRPEKSMLITGLRGVGKTVILNEIDRRARGFGYRTILIEVHESKSFPAMLVPALRRVLFDLDRAAGFSDKVKRGLAVLTGFVGALKVRVGEMEIGLDIDSQPGVADSGDLELDLPDLFEAVADAAKDRETGIALLVDEIQYLGRRELSALIMAMHRMQQRGLPFVLVGAGLPTLPALAGDSKSYAERLFNFPCLGRLREDDAATAVQDPIRDAGLEIQEQALVAINSMARGYPYFIQEWAYQTWNRAQTSPITVRDVEAATQKVVERLDQGFFRVRFDRLTPREKTCLRHMAGLGPGPHNTGDVAAAMGMKVTQLSPLRAGLLRKGMIYSPVHGQMAFTVPLFDEFMLRVMP